MDKRLTPENIDYGIGLSRNSIIDKFILASAAFGFLYMGVTLWRDVSFGIVSTNSFINFVITFLPTVTWLFKTTNSIQFLKVVVLFFYILDCQHKVYHAIWHL